MPHDGAALLTRGPGDEDRLLRCHEKSFPCVVKYFSRVFPSGARNKQAGRGTDTPAITVSGA